MASHHDKRASIERSPERSGSHAAGHVSFEGSLHQTAVSHNSGVVMCCEFNPDASLVAAGLSNGIITIMKPTSGCREVYRLNSKTCGALPVTSVRFLSNHTTTSTKEHILLATYASGYSLLWHVTTGQVLSRVKEDRQSLASAVAPGGETFCTAGSDGCLFVYDTETHAKMRTLEPSKSTTLMDGHVNRVFSSRYHPANPSLLVSAGWDETIQFWDIRYTQATKRIYGPHVCGDGISIHPTSYQIATASWRLKDSVQVWDYNNGKLLKSLQPELSIKSYTVTWVGDHYLLVGGSQQNKAVLIDANRDWVTASVSGMDNGVYDTDYNSVGRTVAVAAGNNLYFGVWKKRSSSQEILIP